MERRGVVRVETWRAGSLLVAQAATATWLGDDGLVLEQAGGFGDLEDAINWGRDRAEVVLVVECEENALETTYSAGDADPGGQQLARLRPRAGEATMSWIFSSSWAVPEGLASEDFAVRLARALATDGAVDDPGCHPIPTHRPVEFAVSGAARVAVEFRLTAPTRRAAFDAALDALFRQLSTAGWPGGGWTAPFDVRPEVAVVA